MGVVVVEEGGAATREVTRAAAAEARDDVDINEHDEEPTVALLLRWSKIRCVSVARTSTLSFNPKPLPPPLRGDSAAEAGPEAAAAITVACEW
jgi:hypothetical protein